ncbi:mannose-1-phosphate guanylyltransferase [Odoribacter sp. OttesenSCG-928-L07]|nr:mannose-1-phosphate guanylyltransferase [Odoribacter sp. OttesenSCG-928-L07]MDL2239335.1 mannose-1-phosphate guanylyltransferase [Bacteroidales bacterium OttesenSCG-928-L14]MDL2240380.1 mannose-1-phosphate guanylyltransferase [Bacteroidales bacterium OttesenSCG-928-K22]
MNKNFYAVIMAGGIGSRFWPMSRTETPKQFIDILGTGESLIRQTFLRLNKICPAENIFVVTSEQYQLLTLEHLPELKPSNVLCEPVRRNTAPCIAYANYKILTKNPDAQVIVAPSDHIILKEDVFINVATEALNESGKHDCLITLGITPSRPDTGYGYIQIDEDSNEKLNDKILKVKTFTEKPNFEMATFFLKSGDFVWNSGIFIWSAKSIQRAFQKYLPEIDELFAKGKSMYDTSLEKEFIEKTYYICKSISIDYGVMEKADNVFVYQTDFGWSDLGTWVSLFDNSNRDENNNACIGSEILTYDTENSVIVSHNKNKLVVIQGLNDVIVVDEGDVLLICNKNNEQKIKDIVDDVKQKYNEKYI